MTFPRIYLGTGGYADTDLIGTLYPFGTKKEDFLPESEMRLLLLDLKSIDDEQFSNKYKNKLNFYSGDCDFRNIVLFLLKFFSIENKCIVNNNNSHKKCFKRVHLELRNDNFFDNNNFIRSKPVFKAN